MDEFLLMFCYKITLHVVRRGKGFNVGKTRTPVGPRCNKGQQSLGQSALDQMAGPVGSTSNARPTPLNALSGQPSASTGVQRSPNGIGRGPPAYQLISNGITVGQGGRLFPTQGRSGHRQTTGHLPDSPSAFRRPPTWARKQPPKGKNEL
jgi:hypothetical protein